MITRLAMLLAMLCAVAYSYAAFDLKITKSGPADLVGRFGTPNVADAFYGLRADLTVKGTQSKPCKVRFRIGSQVAEWSGQTFGAGSYWWWAVFDSSLDGDVPYEIWIDPDGVTGDTNPADNHIVGTFRPRYPSSPIERMSSAQMDVSDGATATFKPATGTIGRLDMMFGEPLTSTSESNITNYSPPAGSEAMTTSPNSINVHRVQWLNLNTSVQSQVSAQRSFSCTLNSVRVNRDLLEAIPWSSLDQPLPADVQVFRKSEVSMPTDDPVVVDFVGKYLPADYRSNLSPYAAARTLFLGVVKTMHYGTPQANPIECLRTGHGDCGNFAYAFVAGMRRIGFAARLCAGWRMGDSVWHVWSEFYMPGVGWVPADATDSDGLDPDGNFAYRFGNVQDFNQRCHVSFGGDIQWPDATMVVDSLQTPNWYWTGGATYQSYTATTSLKAHNALELIPGAPSVVGGKPVSIVLQVRDAPTGGSRTYTLASSNPTVAKVPDTVTLPNGATQVQFAADTSVVASSAPVTLTATSGGTSAMVTLTVLEPQPELTFASSSVSGGSTIQATITLPSVAPAGGQTVVLAGSNGVTAPATVLVTAGAKTASFAVTAGSMSTISCARLAATTGDGEAEAYVMVLPSSGASFGISFNAAHIASNGTVTGTVTLGSVAPAGGAVVNLSSSRTTALTVPATVTVPAGSSSVTFTGQGKVTGSAITVTVTASRSGLTSQKATVMVLPPSVVSITTPLAIVTGGNPTTATVTLSLAAPTGGVVVTTTSSNTVVATVPANVTVLAGQTSATYTVTTIGVATKGYSALRANTSGNTAKSVQVSVAPSLLKTVTANPNPVKGGTTCTGTVTLNGTAPAAGYVVSLMSSQPSIITVPSSVKIPAGQTSTTFTITTKVVTSTKSGRVTASHSGSGSPSVLIWVTN